MEPLSEYLPFGRPNFSDEEIEAVTRVMRSGWVGMGPETQKFEAELSERIGRPTLLVSSCTSALHLSLHALGIGPGDEVICPSLTWCATANAAIYTGATPVFCDVNNDHLSADIESIMAVVTPQTKAVVVVHFGGYAIDVQALRNAIPDHIHIVEDAAHAFGARYPDGRIVGDSGNLTCFSFYANKNLSTAEGGAVVVSDQAQNEMIQSLRQHGADINAWQRFTNQNIFSITPIERLGFKANYTDLQAAIGRVQLARFDELQNLRDEVAAVYQNRLQSKELGIRFQLGCFAPAHARHLLPALLPVESLSIDRHEVVRQLRKRNIGATIHYLPLHWMPYYQQYVGADLPNTDGIAQRIISLPISSAMTPTQADTVCDHLIEILTTHRTPSASR